jgi:hypothetical protein
MAIMNETTVRAASKQLPGVSNLLLVLLRWFRNSIQIITIPMSMNIIPPVRLATEVMYEPSSVKP